MNILFTLHKNKKGSVSVFVVIAFAAFMVVASVFFAAAKSAAARSYADAAFLLAGRSVLSEYDQQLMKDYGIMAFRGNEKFVEDDMRYYAGASLESDKLIYAPYRNIGYAHINAIDSKIGSIDANLKEYSLLDVDNFEEQIIAGFIQEWIKDKIGKKKRNKNAELSEENEDDNKNRKLRNESILSGLPSQAYDASFFPDFNRVEDVPLLEDVFNQATSSFAVNEYILSCFSNKLYSFSDEDRFFTNEVEYIISGAKSDVANSNFMYAKLFGMRFVLNNIFLFTNPKKQNEIKAASALITAASGGYIPDSQIAILEAWATAESVNDINRLMDGKKVSLFKTDSTWATQNVVEIAKGFIPSVIVNPKSETGQDYEDYLRIMLFLCDREVKILRIMDLIQINLKGTYYKEFLLREHYVGFRVSCEYGRDQFDYVQKY